MKLFVDAACFWRGSASANTGSLVVFFAATEMGRRSVVGLSTSCTTSAHAGSKFGACLSGGSCSFAGQATSHQVDRDVSARRMHHSSTKDIVSIAFEPEQIAVLKGGTEAPAIGDNGYV